MSNDWGALQERFTAAFESFLAACSQLDPACYEQTTIDGQWTLKDIVAHLTGWEHEATERFWRFLAGPTDDITYEIDSFNSRSVAARQHLSWNQALKELKMARSHLQEAIATTTPDDLARESRFTEWLQSITRHYQEHTAQLHALQR